MSGAQKGQMHEVRKTHKPQSVARRLRLKSGQQHKRLESKDNKIQGKQIKPIEHVDQLKYNFCRGMG